jgi:hypothetical protein
MCVIVCTYHTHKLRVHQLAHAFGVHAVTPDH